MKLIDNLNQELIELLDKNPELRAKQREIDNNLNRLDNNYQRCYYITEEMLDSLSLLNDELQDTLKLLEKLK